MKLTSLNVQNWKPSAARQEILDRDGLYFIVQPSGVKSWALRYRRKSDGKAVKHTIGSYPMLSLKDARSAATALRAEIGRGADPHGANVGARPRLTTASRRWCVATSPTASPAASVRGSGPRDCSG